MKVLVHLLLVAFAPFGDCLLCPRQVDNKAEFGLRKNDHFVLLLDIFDEHWIVTCDITARIPSGDVSTHARCFSKIDIFANQYGNIFLFVPFNIGLTFGENPEIANAEILGKAHLNDVFRTINQFDKAGVLFMIDKDVPAFDMTVLFESVGTGCGC